MGVNKMFWRGVVAGGFIVFVPVAFGWILFPLYIFGLIAKYTPEFHFMAPQLEGVVFWGFGLIMDWISFWCHIFNSTLCKGEIGPEYLLAIVSLIYLIPLTGAILDKVYGDLKSFIYGLILGGLQNVIFAPFSRPLLLLILLPSILAIVFIAIES